MIKLILNRQLIWCFFSFCSVNSIAQTNRFQKEGSEAFELYKVIHQNPELGRKEFKTAELIKSKLREAGYSNFYQVKDLSTAVITSLDTHLPGPVIALRAELDARSDSEATGLPYSSKIAKIMHNCGHDAHAAILYSAAVYLKSNVQSLKGKIIFIFQPAEETRGGADDIVNSGILEELGVEHIFALHAVSKLPVGKVSVSSGYIMAGSYYFTVEVKGKGSHAATPYEGVNLPLVIGDLVRDLASLPVTKMAISERPCVISTTFIEIGNENNLNTLPSTGKFKGTIRAYEDISSPFKDQLSITALIEQTLKNYCVPNKIEYSLKINKGSPPTFNNTDLFNKIVPKINFSGKIDTTPYKGMFSEDFAYYTEKFPCLYFGWGIAKDSLGLASVHTNTFTIHPDAFSYGVELMVNLATESQ